MPARKGNTASATGCGRLLAQAITPGWRDRADLGSRGLGLLRLGVRRDRAAPPSLVLGHRPDDPVGDRGDRQHRPGEWTAIASDVFDEVEQRWVSDAEVAEVPFTAFTGRRKAEHVSCRLVVRVNESSHLHLTAANRASCSPPTPTPSSPQHPVHDRADQRHRDRPGRAGHRRTQGGGRGVACSRSHPRATAVAAAMRTARCCAHAHPEHPRPDRDHRSFSTHWPAGRARRPSTGSAHRCSRPATRGKRTEAPPPAAPETMGGLNGGPVSRADYVSPTARPVPSRPSPAASRRDDVVARELETFGPVIESFVAAHGRITRSEAAQLCGVEPEHGSALLRALVGAGRLEMRGARRGSHYVMAGASHDPVGAGDSDDHEGKDWIDG